MPSQPDVYVGLLDSHSHQWSVVTAETITHIFQHRVKTQRNSPEGKRFDFITKWHKIKSTVIGNTPITENDCVDKLLNASVALWVYLHVWSVECSVQTCGKSLRPHLTQWVYLHVWSVVYRPVVSHWGPIWHSECIYTCGVYCTDLW